MIIMLTPDQRHIYIHRIIETNKAAAKVNNYSGVEAEHDGLSLEQLSNANMWNLEQYY